MTYNGYMITMERGLYVATLQDIYIVAATKDELFTILDSLA